ncbi:MAG: porin family protein [Pseudomonadota bacterium]
MKLVLSSLAALGLVALPAAAQDSNFYGDVGYQFINVDEDGIEADLGTIVAHGGYQFTDFLSAEGELAVGIQDEDVTVSGVDVEVGLNYLIGAYGRVQAPLGENLTVFARAGIVNAELEAEASGGGITVSESDSETGAGFGVGGEFHFDGVNGIRLDYTRYDIEDLEADAFTIAYSRKF